MTCYLDKAHFDQNQWMKTWSGGEEVGPGMSHRRGRQCGWEVGAQGSRAPSVGLPLALGRGRAEGSEAGEAVPSATGGLGRVAHCLIHCRLGRGPLPATLSPHPR